MAEVNLGRASLSVTADLSNFVQGIEDASAKSRGLGNSFASAATSSNKITTATEKQWGALNQLQRAAIFNLATQKSNNIQTDIATRKLELQAKQMLIDSGAAAKLAKELSALEKAEKKLADAESKINAAAGRGSPAKEKSKTTSKAASGGMKLTDMVGIGFFTAVFDKMFTSIGNVIGSVIKLGTNIIDAGAKFQQVDIRLNALTGISGMAQGLQDIMKSGPSASFETLAENATRLAALKFDANSIQILTAQFNKLGISLGNPEKIMALIVDKIGDMASEGNATTAALDKLAEEGVNAYTVLAARMKISEAEAKAAVASGIVTVAEASSAIGALANDPKYIEGFKKTANSFYGIWQTASNNILALFQKIGGYFVEGFSLVSLSETITKTFKSIGNKLDELKPFFLKFGVFVSSVFEIIGNTVTDFFKGWSDKAGEFNLEEMLKSTKIAALDFGKSLIETVKLITIGIIELINNSKALIKTLQALQGVQGQSWGDWFKHIAGLTPNSGFARQFAADQQEKLNVPISTDKTEKFFNDQINKLDILKRETAKPLEFGPPRNLMGSDQIDKTKKELQDLIQFYKDNAVKMQPGVAFDEWEKKTDKLIAFNAETKKIFAAGLGINENAGKNFQALDNVLKSINPKIDNVKDAFANLNDEINRKEPPKWEKFLAENLTPLQTYQNEIAKLNMLMKDGSAQGFQAFAIGSAGALAKLKSSMGISGEQKFASAITRGSAEDFKATIDMQSKNKDVQQEIKELMALANQMQAEQLAEQKKIAAAILAQRPAQVLAFCGPV